jgi:(2Fe-2S) ferredoxin
MTHHPQDHPRPSTNPIVPSSTPYAKHIFICVGSFCNPDGQATVLYAKLQAMLGDLARYYNPKRVKRGITPCLGVCGGGPLMVVYPDGIWYHHIDEALLRRIVDEHLRNDNPVESAIFHVMFED